MQLERFYFESLGEGLLIHAFPKQGVRLAPESDSGLRLGRMKLIEELSHADAGRLQEG